MGRFVCWFPIALVAIFFGTATATIINIPIDYSTIQAGIAASSNGDTVRVAPGTYVENINFGGKNIVVGSWYLDSADSSYIASTIIDGGASGTVVTFVNGETSEARIIGFTIQNGNGDNGGGIYCSNSNPTISNNTISGNTTVYSGGGISCFNSDPTISHNTISGNTASAIAGGIDCYWNSDPIIEYNIISGNTALAMYASAGGINCDLSSPTINHNIISVNTAGYLGGGINCYGGSPTISYNTVSGNMAGSQGGGISCQEASPTISYNTINGNLASGNFGGGIYCDANSSPLIDHNTISQNSAAGGGGIYCWNSNPTITSTIFWDDTTYVEVYLSGTSSPVITFSDVQDTLWPGTGNISCDPQFCDAPNENFSLNAGSCCLGSGESGSDIGAFGIGCGQPVPTLSEWGMMIMGLLLLAAGTAAVIRRKNIALRNVRYRSR